MLAADEGIWPPSQWAWRSYSSLIVDGRMIAYRWWGSRKRYSPSDLPLRSIPPRLTARCLPLTAAGGQGPQGNTASLHPPQLRFAVLLLSGRKRYSPSDLTLRSIPPRLTARCPPAYGRGWPVSSGQHRLRPMHKSTVAIPCLPARSTHKPFAPLPLTSLAGTTNLSSCMGLSTIIRHGAIYHRAVWDH